MWAGLGALPNRPRLKVTAWWPSTVSKASVVSSCGTRPILLNGLAR